MVVAATVEVEATSESHADAYWERGGGINSPTGAGKTEGQRLFLERVGDKLPVVMMTPRQALNRQNAAKLQAANVSAQRNATSGAVFKDYSTIGNRYVACPQSLGKASKQNGDNPLAWNEFSSLGDIPGRPAVPTYPGSMGAIVAIDEVRQLLEDCLLGDLETWRDADHK